MSSLRFTMTKRQERTSGSSASANYASKTSALAKGDHTLSSFMVSKQSSGVDIGRSLALMVRWHTCKYRKVQVRLVCARRAGADGKVAGRGETTALGKTVTLSDCGEIVCGSWAARFETFVSKFAQFAALTTR